MEHSIHLYSMTPSVCQREKERGWVWNRMRLHSYPEGEEMWKNIKRTWTSNLTELHKISFQPLIIKIHKGLMVGLISYIWISALLFHKDTKRVNQRTAEEPRWHSMNALTAFLQCSSMCYFSHAETCIKMKCHTSLPFQPVVQFIFLSSDRVHKFNNCLLSWSLYSLSASYSVFSLCRLAGNASF